MFCGEISTGYGRVSWIDWLCLLEPFFSFLGFFDIFEILPTLASEDLD
jgi:hypothetical protein